MGTQADDDFKNWFKAKVDEMTGMIEGLIKTGKQMPPCLMAFSPTNQVAIVPVELNDPEDKETATMLQATMAQDTELCAGVMLMFESWIVATSDKDSLKRGESIKFHPDREEAICISCMRGDMQMMATRRIERPGNTLAKPIIFDVNGKESSASGRFIPGNTPPEGKVH